MSYIIKFHNIKNDELIKEKIFEDLKNDKHNFALCKRSTIENGTPLIMFDSEKRTIGG